MRSAALNGLRANKISSWQDCQKKTGDVLDGSPPFDLIFPHLANTSGMGGWGPSWGQSPDCRAQFSCAGHTAATALCCGCCAADAPAALGGGGLSGASHWVESQAVPASVSPAKFSNFSFLCRTNSIFTGSVNPSIERGKIWQECARNSACAARQSLNLLYERFTLNVEIYIASFRKLFCRIDEIHDSVNLIWFAIIRSDHLLCATRDDHASRNNERASRNKN